MSCLDWFLLGLGVVQSFATLGALYYAWRTVKQAAATAREHREERTSRRLGDIIDVTADLYQKLIAGSYVHLPPLQAQLGALLTGVDQPLPRCLEFARAPLRNDEERIAAQHVGKAALEELAAVARGGT